jgi:hypothetical protein
VRQLHELQAHQAIVKIPERWPGELDHVEFNAFAR